MDIIVPSAIQSKITFIKSIWEQHHQLVFVIYSEVKQAQIS